MEQSRPKRVRHQPLVYEDERSVHLLLGTVVTPTIHSSCKKPVWRNFKVGNLHIYGWKILVNDFWQFVELNDEIFMNVGGLSSSGYSIGDCSWVKENFDPTEVYKSFLRGTHLYIQGQLTKSCEEHNHAQPTVNDLRSMYAVKNNSKLLPYSIFISRIVDYLPIDVSDTIIVEYTDKDHLVGESLIHKMGIYKYGSTWQYQEDYTTIGLDYLMMIIRMTQVINMLQLRGSLLDLHLRTLLLASISWKLWSNGLTTAWIFIQGLKDSYFAGMEQYEERQTAYSDNQFRELRNLIQSTAEAQNALFCSGISESYLCLSGEIRTLSFLPDHTDDPHPHLNLSLEDFRPRISYL
ncbi:hypothetical protein Lal_00035351, partial [Lupinus albus]